MAFKLVVSDTVTVSVQGKLPDAGGKLQAFSYSLTARRMPQSELSATLKLQDVSFSEWLAERITGWSGVLDQDGNEVPFTPPNLAVLLDVVGMSSLITTAYLESCGARGQQKN